MIGTPVRILPDAVVDLAYKIYANDMLHAVDRLTESLSPQDLNQLIVVAVRDGPAAAEAFYRGRPRKLIRIMPRRRLGLR